MFGGEPVIGYDMATGTESFRHTLPTSRTGGHVTVLGALSPDGYSINTQQPSYQPSGTPPAWSSGRCLRIFKCASARCAWARMVCYSRSPTP